MSTTVPEIPGVQIPEGQQLYFLREHVRDILQLNSTKYVQISLTLDSQERSLSRSISNRSIFFYPKSTYPSSDLAASGFVKSRMVNAS